MRQTAEPLRSPLSSKRPGQLIRQRAAVELLFRQRRRCEAVKVRRPVGNEGEGPGACPEQEDGIKAELIHNPGLTVTITGSLDDIQDFQDTLAIGEDPEFLIEQKHIVSQVTDFLVDVEALGGTNDLDFTMPLELEPIPDRDRERLKTAVIPNHADFINNEKRPRLKLEITDVFDGDIVAARNPISGIDRPTTGKML